MNIAQLGTKGFWLGVGQRLSSLFDEPGEEIASGVRKFSRQNRPARYVFSMGLVSNMTLKNLVWNLRTWNFFEEFHLQATLEKDDSVVRLAGDGFSLNDPPRLYLMEEVVRIGGPFSLEQGFDASYSSLAYTQKNMHLDVPYSLEDRRDWDAIARRMRAVFLISRP